MPRRKKKPTKVLKCRCGEELPVYGIPLTYAKKERAFWLDHFSHLEKKPEGWR